MASQADVQLAALAAGFTIGFGFLTVWEAIKQTRRNRNPLRSAYIYMVWGEILVNITIGIIGWIFLDGVIGPTVPVLFFILFLWVFEIQLLMQIIINRIALIAEHRRTVQRMKWGTVVVITTINIAVFCIWIPSHLNPPASQLFVDINNIWDKASKVLILLVDAYLNWYFLDTVKKRLVQQHGLVKYKPLIGFNAKLMVVSIAMDGMLIGLMFLKNQVVYIQFHPVAYMVKLNIEMSMASLVVRLARGKPENDVDYYPHSSSNHAASAPPQRSVHAHDTHLKSFQLSSITAKGTPMNPKEEGGDGLGAIHCRTDLNVVVERVISKSDVERESSRSSNERHNDFSDEAPLNKSGFRVAEAHVV